jgi:hypothetical protein
VGLVEELGVRQGDRGAADVGVALAGDENGAEFRVLGALGRLAAAVEAGEQLRPEAELLAVAGLEGGADPEGAEGRRVGRVAAAAVESAAGGEGAQLVGLRVKLLRSRSTSTARMLSWAPPKTLGIGSETARI